MTSSPPLASPLSTLRPVPPSAPAVEETVFDVDALEVWYGRFQAVRSDGRWPHYWRWPTFSACR